MSGLQDFQVGEWVIKIHPLNTLDKPGGERRRKVRGGRGERGGGAWGGGGNQKQQGFSSL